MTYTYFDFYDTDPYAYAYAYRMFDDVAPAGNGTPQFGQIWPR